MNGPRVREKLVTARKDHRCMTCRRNAVKAGQEYYRQTYLIYGGKHDYKQCVSCRDATYGASSYVPLDDIDEVSYDTAENSIVYLGYADDLVSARLYLADLQRE